MKTKIALDRPVPYQIKVPGLLGESWSDWIDAMSITVDCEGSDWPITTLTGAVDQATLQSVLSRLYALGLPLISVRYIEGD